MFNPATQQCHVGVIERRPRQRKRAGTGPLKAHDVFSLRLIMAYIAIIYRDWGFLSSGIKDLDPLTSGAHINSAVDYLQNFKAQLNRDGNVSGLECK